MEVQTDAVTSSVLNRSFPGDRPPRLRIPRTLQRVGGGTVNVCRRDAHTHRLDRRGLRPPHGFRHRDGVRCGPAVDDRPRAITPKPTRLIPREQVDHHRPSAPQRSRTGVVTISDVRRRRDDRTVGHRETPAKELDRGVPPNIIAVQDLTPLDQPAVVVDVSRGDTFTHQPHDVLGHRLTTSQRLQLIR